MPGTRIFISYSHRDEALLNKLKPHLAMLKHQGLLDTWTDRQILPGTEWEGEISEHLEAAQIVLLLVSADFVTSRYCYEIEMERALARHEAGDATVIPVILRLCDWQKAPFGKLQPLPKNGKPVTTWNPRDDAWLDVARGLRRVLEEGGRGPTPSRPGPTPHNLPFPKFCVLPRPAPAPTVPR